MDPDFFLSQLFFIQCFYFKEKAKNIIFKGDFPKVGGVLDPLSPTPGPTHERTVICLAGQYRVQHSPPFFL